MSIPFALTLYNLTTVVTVPLHLLVISASTIVVTAKMIRERRPSLYAVAIDLGARLSVVVYGWAVFPRLQR